MTDKLALYFGCANERGHWLQSPGLGKTFDPTRAIPGFPWSIGSLDGGLLKNAKIPDVVDGRVIWTCGGRPDLWFAFVWWDRSGNSRPGSNSGFYVRGFGPDVAERASISLVARDAFAFAKATYPKIVARQAFPLVLQENPK